MKKNKILSIIIIFTIVATITACDKGVAGNKDIIKSPSEKITVIDDVEKEKSEPDVTVVKIDKYENTEISDWVDEDTVIASKDNESLDKLRLLELSDLYPKSLYLFNVNSKKYKLLKEKDDTFLGEARLSKDKKHLIYSEYTLGDPAYYVMNMDTLDTFAITGDRIGGAMSAKWAGDGKVIGGAYSGDAYLNSVNGEITVIDGLEGENVYIVDKIKDNVYYNTNVDETLMLLNMKTKKKTSLELKHVNNVLPSPDLNQILVTQINDSKKTLVLCDIDGGNKKTIAEGAELSGVSWSPDQQRIAYNLKLDANGTTVNGLYIYDMLTGKATQIAIVNSNLATYWSPSGEKLVYTELNGIQYSSSIVSLKFTLE